MANGRSPQVIMWDAHELRIAGKSNSFELAKYEATIVTILETSTIKEKAEAQLFVAEVAADIAVEEEVDRAAWEDAREHFKKARNLHQNVAAAASAGIARCDKALEDLTDKAPQDLEAEIG